VSVGGRDLEPRLEEWVSLGIISPEQATAIRELHRDTPRPRGLIRELLAYLGAVLVVAAGFILVSEFWEDIDTVGRILLSLAAGAILTVTGVSLVSSPRPTTRRAGQTALLLAAAPVGFTAGMVMDVAISNEDWSATTGFVVAFAYSAFFYAGQKSIAQHVALLLSAAGSTIAVASMLEGDEGSWITGAALAALGLGWASASSIERLPPRVVGEIGGMLALGFGSLIVVASLGSEDGGGIAAMAMWILVSIGFIAAGVRRDEVVFIVGGVIGLLVYVTWLAGVVFGDGVSAPVSLLFAGGLLIGTAVYLSRRARGS
jgi:hypothetical protein